MRRSLKSQKITEKQFC